jgi:Flp pilus assembly protein TadG
MRIRLLRSHRRSRGQALVEFALVLPIFILVLVGLFDAGRAVYAHNTVANSARAAARVAIVNQSPDVIRDRAVEMGVALGLTSSDVTLVPCGSMEAGCMYRVTVAWDYQPITPLIGDVFNPTISSTAEMPVEFVNP